MNGDASDGSALRLVHAELIRIEDHWTMQVQNQQQRIATVVALNGGSVALLTAAGLNAGAQGWTLKLLVASLFMLIVALGVGILGVLPRTAIQRGTTVVRDLPSDMRWLDSAWVWEQYCTAYGVTGPAWVVAICDSLAANECGNRAHHGMIWWRRWVLCVQLGLIGVAFLVLSVAVALQA